VTVSAGSGLDNQGGNGLFFAFIATQARCQLPWKGEGIADPSSKKDWNHERQNRPASTPSHNAALDL
jgi:hypothetical protein